MTALRTEAATAGENLARVLADKTELMAEIATTKNTLGLVVGEKTELQSKAGQCIYCLTQSSVTCQL